MKRILNEIINRQVKTILTENKISNTIFISYGTDRFDENNFRQPIFNSSRVLINNKPVGGLWASPIDAKYGWVDFCDCNAFHLKTLAKHFLFKLKPESKIYVIDNYDDLKKISTIPDYLGQMCINWELLQDYDGIFVTDKGRNLRYVKGMRGLDAWDVSSICIFNPSIIIPIKENAFDKAKVSKREVSDYGDEYGLSYDDKEARKYLQMQSDFDKYSNMNITGNMSDLFNGEHPAILAQKHGNNKDARLARKFKGMVKQGLD
jgi:hypothetical protein